MMWINKMVDEDRQTLLKDARKEGSKLRAKHRQNDQKYFSLYEQYGDW